MIIINKNELDPDLIHDINLELEALFTDNQCILWYSNFEGERCYLILWNKNDHYK